MVLSQAIVADVPARQRGRYMGIMGAVCLPPSSGHSSAGSSPRPGWRWALWFNPPGLPPSPGRGGGLPRFPRRGAGRRTDWAGTLLMATGTTALILPSAVGRPPVRLTDPAIALGAVFLVCAVAFVLVELRSADPLIPMTLFSATSPRPPRPGSSSCTTFGCIVDYPRHPDGPRASPTAAGLMMTPMMAGMMGTRSP